MVPVFLVEELRKQIAKLMAVCYGLKSATKLKM
jgi:hypothetical protein